MAGLITLRAAQHVLTNAAPLPFTNVKVHRSSLEDGVYGECAVDSVKESITIKVRKDSELIVQLDSLIHEWAHARLAPLDDFEKHGALWGV